MNGYVNLSYNIAPYNEATVSMDNYLRKHFHKEDVHVGYENILSG